MRIPLVLEQATVREWRLEDAESLVRYANDWEVSKTLRDMFPYPYTMANASEFLTRMVESESPEVFCIDIDGAAVGSIGIHPETDVHRFSAQIGYWIGRKFWGRGIMSEVVNAFVESAFETSNLHRIYAFAYATNPASARVLEKAGFVFEGRLKKDIYKAGEFLDSLLYAKTR